MLVWMEGIIMNLDDMAKTPLFRAVKALREIKQFNRLKNDLDAYLLEVCIYGIGDREDWPESKDYGIKD